MKYKAKFVRNMAKRKFIGKVWLPKVRYSVLFKLFSSDNAANRIEASLLSCDHIKGQDGTENQEKEENRAIHMSAHVAPLEFCKT